MAKPQVKPAANKIKKGQPAQYSEAPRWLCVAVATAACFAALCFCYFGGGQYPFGANTLATGETASHLLPLAAAVGENGLGHSLAFGLGGDVARLALQTLASPFTLLLLLPGVSPTMGVNLVVLARLVAAAFGASLLFTSKYAPFSPGNRLGAVLGFWYAFGGYALAGAGGAVAALDLFWLLPLGTLALCLLARKGQVLPFALALCAGMAMVPLSAAVLLPLLALFAAVWLLFFASPKEGGALALRLLAAFLPAALLSAPVWVPVYFGGAATGGVSGLFTGMLLFEGALARLILLLCGGALVAALALTIWGGLHRQKNVRFLLVCLGISVVPVVFTPVAEFWNWLGGINAHALLYLPGWLSVLLLAAALEALFRRPERAENHQASLLMAGVNVAVFAGVSVYLVFNRYGLAAVVGDASASEYFTGLTMRYILFYALVTTVVLFGLAALRGGLDLTRRVFALALAVVLAVSGLYSGLVYLVPVLGGPLVRNPAGDAAIAARLGEEAGGVSGRVKTASAGLGATLPAAAGFASLGAGEEAGTSLEALTAYKKLGYSGYGSELSGHGGTILSDAFLNVEYVLGAVLPPNISTIWVWDDFYADWWYFDTAANFVLDETGVFLAATPAANGWATVVYGDAGALATMPEGDRFDAQDWLYRTVFGGEGAIMRRYEATYTEGVSYEEYDDQLDRYGVWQASDGTAGVLEYTIPVGAREALYFDCFRFISADLDEIVNDGLAVSVNGSLLEGLYPSRESNGLLYLGTYENETVTVRVDLLRSELVRSFGVAGVLEDDVLAVAENLPATQANISGGTMTFTAEAGAGALLVLPMAYDQTARAAVNGQGAVVHRVLDGLMAVELMPGANTVQIAFAGASPLPGILLLLAGLALAALLWLACRGRVAVGAAGQAGENQTAAEKLCRLALLLAGGAAVLLLFLAPLALWAGYGLFAPAAG